MSNRNAHHLPSIREAKKQEGKPRNFSPRYDSQENPKPVSSGSQNPKSQATLQPIRQKQQNLATKVKSLEEALALADAAVDQMNSVLEENEIENVKLNEVLK